MNGNNVISTHDLIEKLQEYEKENGIGAIQFIGRCTDLKNSSFCYELEIANDSKWNKCFDKNSKYKETNIRVHSVLDDELFPDRISMEEVEKWRLNEENEN